MIYICKKIVLICLALQFSFFTFSCGDIPCPTCKINLLLSDEVIELANLYEHHIGRPMFFDLLYFDNKQNKKVDLCILDFPLTIECAKRNCVSIVFLPQENFVPATAVFPWELQPDKSSLILKFDNGWLGSQLYAVVESSFIEYFNYVKAQEFLFAKKGTLEGGSCLFLDEQRLRHDLSVGKVNSYSWRLKKFALWDISYAMAMRICNHDSTLIFCDYKADLCQLLVINESQEEPLYQLKIPSGFHTLYDFTNGIKWQLCFDETKNPAVLSLEGRID